MKRDGKQLKTSGSLPEQSIQNLFLFLLKNLSVQIKCSLQKMACHNYCSTELIEPRANVQSWALFKSHMPNLYRTPQTKLDVCIQNFSPVSTFSWVEGERTARYFSKVALFYEGSQKLHKITKTTSLFQGRLPWIVAYH